jgi:hypothetical protein
MQQVLVEGLSNQSVVFGVSNQLPLNLQAGMPGAIGFLGSASPTPLPGPTMTTLGTVAVSRADGVTTKIYPHVFGSNSNGDYMLHALDRRGLHHHITSHVDVHTLFSSFSTGTTTSGK